MSRFALPFTSPAKDTPSKQNWPTLKVDIPTSPRTNTDVFSPPRSLLSARARNSPSALLSPRSRISLLSPRSQICSPVNALSPVDKFFNSKSPTLSPDPHQSLMLGSDTNVFSPRTLISAICKTPPAPSSCHFWSFSSPQNKSCDESGAEIELTPTHTATKCKHCESAREDAASIRRSLVELKKSIEQRHVELKKTNAELTAVEQLLSIKNVNESVCDAKAHNRIRQLAISIKALLEKNSTMCKALAQTKKLLSTAQVEINTLNGTLRKERADYTTSLLERVPSAARDISGGRCIICATKLGWLQKKKQCVNCSASVCHSCRVSCCKGCVNILHVNQETLERLKQDQEQIQKDTITNPLSPKDWCSPRQNRRGSQVLSPHRKDGQENVRINESVYDSDKENSMRLPKKTSSPSVNRQITLPEAEQVGIQNPKRTILSPKNANINRSNPSNKHFTLTKTKQTRSGNLGFSPRSPKPTAAEKAVEEFAPLPITRSFTASNVALA